MSSISAGSSKTAVRTRTTREQGWFAALGVKGRRAFRAAYAGYMLDAFDLIVLTLSLSAIGATFSVGTGATGALSTVTLSASAVGGILGGVLADRIGRARRRDRLRRLRLRAGDRRAGVAAGNPRARASGVRVSLVDALQDARAY